MTGQPHDMYAIFDTLLERGVLSPEALIAAPELHDALQAALYRHALRIASAEENKKHLAALHMTAEDAGNEMWIRFFSGGDEQHGVRDQLSRALRALQEQGTPFACRYLSRMMQLELKQMLNTRLYRRSHPAPEVETQAPSPELSYMQRQMLLNMLRHTGKDFMQDTVMLGRVLGMGPKLIAWSFASGKHEELARCMIRELKALLGPECAEACANLLEAAHSFQLPEHDSRDEEALLRKLMLLHASSRPMAVGEVPRHPASPARPPLSRHPLDDREDKTEDEPQQ